VVADDGTSLETDETEGAEVELGVPGIVHATLAAGSPRVWLPQQGGFRLYPKVTTAGSKALLLRYEYIPSFPSTATDVFTWPDNHSTILVTRTAKTLREISGMNAQFLMAQGGRLEQDLLVDLKTLSLMPIQFPSSYYRDDYPKVSKQGQVK